MKSCCIELNQIELTNNWKLFYQISNLYIETCLNIMILVVYQNY